MKPLMKRGLFERSPLNSGMRGGMASRIITPWDWILFPALVSLCVTIVLSTPLQPFGLYLPEPVTPFLLAFAWPLIRPSYIAPFVLGGLGLFLDMFTGAPLGFWTLGLMLVYGVLVAVRTYVIGQEWIVVFAVFVLTEVAFFTFCTLVISIDSGGVPRLWGVFEQALATGLGFPAVLYLMEKYLHTDVRFQ